MHLFLVSADVNLFYYAASYTFLQRVYISLENRPISSLIKSNMKTKERKMQNNAIMNTVFKVDPIDVRRVTQ